MTKIVVMTVEETCAVLKEHGMGISPPHLRAGIDCGAYPFGVSIKMSKSNVYEIFRPLLMKWIEERSEVGGAAPAGSSRSHS